MARRSLERSTPLTICPPAEVIISDTFCKEQKINSLDYIERKLSLQVSRCFRLSWSRIKISTTTSCTVSVTGTPGFSTGNIFVSFANGEPAKQENTLRASFFRCCLSRRGGDPLHFPYKTTSLRNIGEPLNLIDITGLAKIQ
jgi:hypothetical protein